MFANGYWGHPAYKLPPEVNLLAVAHYLEALDWQRDIIKIQAILGGKNPHPQTFLVGGMATPVHPTLPNAINNSTIATLQGLVVTARNFVEKVYLPDLKAIAGFYPEWTQSGGGRGDMLSYGEFPEASNARWLPPGIVRNGNLSQVFPVDHMQIVEHVAHSWYAGNTPRHPWQGETQPAYAGPAAPYALESGTVAHVQQVAAHWDGPYQPEYDMNGDGQINVGDIQEAADSWGSPFPAPPRMVSFYDKYSWIKAPRYLDAPMEVGPLTRMAVAYAAGHPENTRRHRHDVGADGPGVGSAFLDDRAHARSAQSKLWWSASNCPSGWGSCRPTSIKTISRSTTAPDGIQAPGQLIHSGMALPKPREARWVTGCTSSTARSTTTRPWCRPPGTARHAMLRGCADHGSRR